MIIVKSFGGFQMTDENVILDEKSIKSVMLTKLIMYLMIHKDRPLSMDNLIDTLWEEDEEVENPIGALKNLMYRLRKLLDKTFGENEYIITSRGTYRWNPDIRVVYDAEKFDSLITEVKTEDDEEKVISKLELATSLYEGEFLNVLKDCYWVQSLRTYYHSMYLSSVKALAELYSKHKEFENLDKLASTALTFDTADEQLFCYQIEARMRMNKIGLALESYDIAREIIEKELGVRKTTILNKVYEELLATSNSSKAYAIDEVHEDILEEHPEGVFFCGYPVFKEIYHLEARKARRSDEEMSLVLLTVEGKKDDNNPSDIKAFRMKQAMTALEECIYASLRVGDVASKYSDSQFILLLASCNDDFAHLVCNRLIANLYEKNSKYRSWNIKMHVESVCTGDDLIK